MKTKELVRRLQEIDPEGDMDCCVLNEDILTVFIEPAYWDGCKQILVREPDCEYYDVIGAKISSKGYKLTIQPISVKDALWDDPDLPIEYDEYSKSHYKESYDKEREHVRKVKKEIEEKHKNV